MSGGGSQTTSSTSTVPPQFLNAYNNTVNRATSVASTPFQSYGGNLVAGFSGDQSAAQQGVRNAQGTSQPYLDAAKSSVAASTQPLWAQTMQTGVSPSSGVAGYDPNFWGSTMQTGVSPSSGVAGYDPNFWGSTMQTGVSPSSGVAGYKQALGVNAADIQKYENPFQSQVIGATEAQIANTDQQQQTQLGGNAAAAGAFGGDRMGVAQGVLGGQQALANNSTLAGLYQSNYNQALGEANQQQGVALNEFNQQQQTQLGANEASRASANSEFNQQQQTQLGANEASRASANSEFNQQQQMQLGANQANASLNAQAGYAYGNLGNEANGLALTDASALSQSGLTQQQQQQAGLNTAYEQWQAQQAFPYQQTGWLANITEGIGSNVGGSSTSTTSSNKDGGRIGRAGGGIVPGFDNGGGILGEIPNVSASYIPGASGGGSGGGGIGRGPPPPQSQPMQPGMLSNPSSDISALSGATSLYKNLGLGGMFGGGAGAGIGAGTEYAGAAAGTAPLTAVAAAPLADLGAAGAAGASGAGAAAGAAGAAGAGGAGFLGSLGSAVEAGAAGIGSAASAVGSGLAAGASAVGEGIAAGGSWLMSLLPALLALKDGGKVEAPANGYQGGIVLPFPQDRARRAHGGIVGNGAQTPYSAAPPVQLSGTDGLPVTMSYMPGSPMMPPPGPGASAMPPSGGGAGGGIGGTLGSMAHQGAFGLLPMLFERGGSVPTRAFGGGIAGHGPGTTAFGFSQPAGTGGDAFSLGAPNATASKGLWTGLARGGIVPQHFDTGGTAAAANDDVWAQAGTPSSGDGWDTPAAAVAATSSPSAASGSGSGAGAGSSGIMGFTPEKPNMWIPALTGIASAVLGRHTNNGRNLAEGVLAGLGSYGAEDARYQAGREKGASLDQEAKKLADDAQFHRDQIAREQQQTDQLGTYQQQEAQNSAARIQAENSHYQAMEGLEGQRNGIEGARVGNEASFQNRELDLRQQLANQMKVTQTGTDASGNPVMMDSRTGRWIDNQGNPYAGQVMPTNYQQSRLDNTAEATRQRAASAAASLQTRQDAMALAHTDREKALAEHADSSTLFAATNLVRADPSGKTTLDQAFTQTAAHRPGGPQPTSSVAAPAPAPQQQAQPTPPAAPTAPQVGMVQQGYRFLGGDASSPQSWQKVQ